MNSPRRGGYESLSVGFLFVAFAVALLIAWTVADWILIFPIFLLEAGAFFAALGIIVRQREEDPKAVARGSSYYAFWGSTIALLGAIWLLNGQYPGNVPMLVAIFLIWIGIVAIAMSLPRFRKGPA